jgi:hypothetical protein
VSRRRSPVRPRRPPVRPRRRPLVRRRRRSPGSPRSRRRRS